MPRCSCNRFCKSSIVAEVAAQEECEQDALFSIFTRAYPYRNLGRGSFDETVEMLGRSIAVGLKDGELVLGRFQSVIFAELDGPRKREITVQVIGE